MLTISHDAARLVRRLTQDADLPDEAGMRIVIDQNHRSLSMGLARHPEPVSYQELRKNVYHKDEQEKKDSSIANDLAELKAVLDRADVWRGRIREAALRTLDSAAENVLTEAEGERRGQE